MKKFFNIIKLFLYKLFTPTNISKIIIIFSIGLFARYLINEYLGINVFTQYLSYTSITFYSIFAGFIVFIHELFSFFNLSIIPNFIWIGFTRIGLILHYLLVEPFLWVYSNFWGKNSYISHMNDPRNSRINSNNSNGSQSSSRHHADSFYERVAQQNPYTRYPSYNRIPHPSHYPATVDPSDLERYEVDRSTLRSYSEYSDTPMTNYESEQDNTYQTGNTTYPISEGYQNRDSGPRYFIVASIDENGITRYVNTPANSNLEIPHTPRGSNLTTPSTMTPLFTSREQLPLNSEQELSQTSLAYTNNTNHGTIGPTRSVSDINWDARRYRVARAFQDVAQPPKFKEIDISANTTRGKVSLGIEYYYSKKNIHSLYIKYHDLTKRKFFWNIWEKGRDNYETYEEFKANFDPQMNIWREIAKTTKTDLSKEIQELLNSNPFGKRSAISTKDIKEIYKSKTQSRLNNLNSSRYNPRDIHRKR